MDPILPRRRERGLLALPEERLALALAGRQLAIVAAS